ncbi:hypothetical protein KAH27_04010 [bacterium]|nr:hypothetical protein [bacterium]
MAFLITILPACFAFARLSLPNNFYYGEAKGIAGICLTGIPNAKVIAKYNEKICAETPVSGFISNNINYILRVPLDDGWEYRFAEYAPRENEFIDIFINYEGIEFPVDDYIPPLGPAETSHETDIQATPEPVSIYFLLLGNLILCVLTQRIKFSTGG